MNLKYLNKLFTDNKLLNNELINDKIFLVLIIRYYIECKEKYYEINNNISVKDVYIGHII
jgi:hypothetical protein